MNALVTLSYEDRLKVSYKAVQARTYGKPRMVNLIAQQSPTVANDAETPDAGLIARSPRGFMKARCVHHGVTFAQMVDSGRMTKKAIGIRKTIVGEIMERFPDLTITHLARLLNRNHTTVLYLLDRMPNKRGNMTIAADREKKAFELYLEGTTIEAIADELAISLSTVKAIKRRNNWESRAKPKGPRSEMAHEREGRRLYELGLTQKEIGDKLGMHHSCIWAMKKRWNWPERAKGK